MQVYFTEVLNKGDPLMKNSLAAAAARRELEGLFEHSVFKEVRIYEVPPGAFILPSKMFCAIKHSGINYELYKALLTVRGYRDWLKQLITHRIANLRHGSVISVS